MTHSESIKEISTAMSKAQAEFDGVTKDASNPFYKSKYATLDAVIKSTKQTLAKNGLAVIQGNEQNETGIVVTTLLTHSSGEWIESKLYLPATKQDPQGYGSAITYGRRYALSAILGIASEEDDDGNSNIKTPTYTPKTTTPVGGVRCDLCHAVGSHAPNCPNKR